MQNACFIKFSSLSRSGLFFFILLVALLASSPLAAKAPEQMPEFALPSALDDTVIDSNTQRGKVLLINFWATWCGPCRIEIPSLIQLHEQFKDRGFSVIGISMDNGNRKIVTHFAKKMEINYPIAMGSSKTARAFGGIIGIPVSFLVDQEGKIIKSYTGLVTHDLMEQDISQLFPRETH